MGKIKCFRQVLDNWNELSKSEPGNFSLKTNDSNEKAYQRAFFNSNGGITTIVRNDKSELKVRWIDMEIPVVPPPPTTGRKRIDLIGLVNEEDFAIAELKGHNNKIDSPLNTIRTVVKYALLAKGYRRVLVVHKNNQFQTGQNYWEHYNDSKYLIVAAPESYWKSWVTSEQLDVLKDMSKNIGDKVGYSIVLAQFLDKKFKRESDGIPRLQVNKNRWCEL